jgi:dephospho-CoA kinase
MIALALTGSIGMGKSTTERMFARHDIPVWDADEAVARLYAAGAAGAEAVAQLVPDAVGPEGVDRDRLRAAIRSDESLLERIEAAIHPLVAEDRERFLARAAAEGADIALCDIPLLFETGGQERFDRVVVVSAPPEVQRERVLRRPGMTEVAFEAMLSRQMPDAEKRARADHVIDTGRGLKAAEAQVAALVSELRRAAGRERGGGDA